MLRQRLRKDNSYLVVIATLKNPFEKAVISTAENSYLHEEEP